MTTTPTAPINNSHDHDRVAEVPAESVGAAWTAKAALTLTPRAKSANPALGWLQTGGAILFVGGFIAMITGATRTFPATFGSSVADALDFAGRSTLIVTAGGVALMLGGMCLVGSLIVAAVKASS